MQAFGWLAIKGAVLMMDNLRHRRIIIVNACPLYLAAKETVDHLLLTYPVVKNVWWTILGWFNCCCIFPNSILPLFVTWTKGVGLKRARIIWNSTFFTAIWTLWKETPDVLRTRLIKRGALSR